MRSGAALLLVAALACGGEPPAAQPPGPAPPPAAESAVTRRVDGERLMATVRTLASPDFAGRRTGSPGNRRARALIIERFASAGLEPLDGGFEQRFRFTHYSIRGLLEPDRPFRRVYADAANVVGAVSGSAPGARTIVVSAHYDHLGERGGTIYPGADDNASGVATLLEAAAWFDSHPPRHRLVFAAFDAEEMGLEGAEAFVDDSPLEEDEIALNVNLDMLSRNERNEIYAAGVMRYPFLRPILDEVRRRSAVKIQYGHDQEDAALDDWSEQSDQAPFAEAGIPFLYFGVEDHADYHRPTDTADKIDPRFFIDVADMVLETLIRLDAADSLD